MIFCFAHRQEPNIIVSWKASSSIRWRQMQRPMLNIRQSPGSLVEEWGMEANKSEKKRTSPQSRLTLDQGEWSQILGHQPRIMQDLDLDHLHICNKCAIWCSYGYPNTWIRDCLGLCSLSLDALTPYLDCLFGPQWERMCIDLLGLDAPLWGRYPMGVLLLWGEEVDATGRGICKGETEKRGGKGAVIRM